MFWKVPRNTRGCSVAFALDILKVWKVPGERFFGIPAAARLRFLHVLEGSSAYPGLLRSIRFLDILKVWKVRGQRFFGIPAAAMLGFVFFMFWKVPRNTRGCSIAFVFLIF